MSYINAIKNYEIHQESTTTSQVISDSYVELSGSRFSYTPISSNNKVILSFSQLFNNRPDKYSKLQIIVQESTDNFFSIVNDISGSHTRIQAQGDGSNYNRDYWFFENQIILDSWSGKKYFRVMMTSGDVDSECTVQHTRRWEGNQIDAYPPVSVLIKEI